MPTDALKYGKRVLVVGLECFHLWRTQEGLDLVGPRYFGIDADYIPIEERCKGGRFAVDAAASGKEAGNV